MAYHHIALTLLGAAACALILLWVFDNPGGPDNFT